MVLQKIGHSLKSCLVPHFKNKCLFIQEYQIPIIALRALSQLNRPFKKGQLIMKWINSQINQAQSIKLRCLKIVQTLLSNQEKRRMREKSHISLVSLVSNGHLKNLISLELILDRFLLPWYSWWRYSIVLVNVCCILYCCILCYLMQALMCAVYSYSLGKCVLYTLLGP